MADNSLPALPISDCSAYQYCGLSKREYFAGQALAGLAGLGPLVPCASNSAYIAERAYELADAMLARGETS